MKSKNNNPYADALNGLDLKDPVSAFFKFCKEREQIRIKREQGESFPWSEDPIFQKGRFLNVFREDDRVSKSIIKFAEGLEQDLPDLVQALFFARWCNKGVVLDAISKDVLADKALIKNKMIAFDSWSNKTAYPVEEIEWNGIKYSRLEAATTLFHDIKDSLCEIIRGSAGDVIVATQAVNHEFKMKNDFPIFMAVIDIAWFRPDIIKPTSPVPTGIGAVAFLDRLQKFLGTKNHQATCDEMIKLQKRYWPNAKRGFLPIDIEYLSCECRKYYSYVNDTKRFEGKNIFSPPINY